MEKKGQVWVETVIYTLIGLAIIGILLAVAKPKIDSMRDKLTIEQSLESVSNIDSKIREVASKGVGNVRLVDELKISKGSFVVDASSDKISWTLDSEYEYSQVGSEVLAGGNLKVLTEEVSGEYRVTIFVSYDNIDLKFNGEEVRGELEAAPTSYSLNLKNEGTEGGKIIVGVVD